MEILAFDDLSKEDLGFLVQGAKALRTGETAEQILIGVASGRGHLLRIVGAAQGIITGQIINLPKGKQFTMGVFAGKGIFPTELASLSDSVFDWALDQGCQWVKFENIHPALDRFYSRKFRREATVFVREIWA